MKTKFLFAILFLVVGALPAQAKYLSTKELVDSCQSAIDIAKNPTGTFKVDEAYNAGLCRGFIEGATTGWDDATVVIEGEGYHTKIRPNATGGDYVRALLAYVKAHPEKENEAAYITLMEALLDAKIMVSQKVNLLPRATEQ